MRFWLSGEVHEDVREAYFVLAREVERLINDRIRKLNFGSGLKSWNVIPIILPKSYQIFTAEITKYEKRTRQCEFRLYIDHAKFKKGPKPEQNRLFCDMLRRSLDFLDSWNIAKLDVQQLRDDFEMAVKDLDPGGAKAASESKKVSPRVSSEVTTKKIRGIKLYRKINRQWHYHEAWVDGESIGEHWGKVGEAGNLSKHKRDRRLSFERNLKRVLQTATAGGYTELEPDDLQSLTIEYKIDGRGNAKELSKRQKLERRLDDILGKTGLGQVDGGSIGSGTMEISCSVVSFRLAKQIIQADLADTTFADYSRFIANDR